MPRSSTDYIVVHGAWTSTEAPDVGVDEIEKWHLDRGFRAIGYHHVITRRGMIEPGRYEDDVGAHVKGYNQRSLGICLVGGRPLSAPDGTVDTEWEFNYRRIQIESLALLLDRLTLRYPDATVIGHRDFPGVTKDCPGFNVRAWWGES